MDSIAPQFIEPNLYELSGQGLSIQYSTTSIAGVPLFSFQHRGKRKSFRGDEIRSIQTETGRIVTVTVESVPDLHTITLNLVIPGMNLDGSDGTMATFAFYDTQLTSIGGPRLVKGQIDRYQTIQVSGKAIAAAY